jgi:hypothetical protein
MIRLPLEVAHLGMDPILETGLLCGLLTGIPHGLGGDGMRGGVPAPARE